MNTNAIKAATTLVIVFNFMGNHPALSQPTYPGLFLDQRSIVQMRQRAEQGPPYSDWAQDVIKRADRHLNAPRPSVTAGGLIGESGDPHDFWTQLPYRHGKTQKDGVVNPKQDRTDYQAAIRLGRETRELALAYALTEDPRYAEGVRDYARAWCLDERTRMNPRFTNNQSRIELCITLPGLFYALDLIWNAPDWDDAERGAVRQWAQAIADSARTWKSSNNFGNWRVVLLAGAGHIAGDEAALDEAFARWRVLLDRQVDDDHFLPEEMRRSKSLFYSTYALSAMVQGAEIARRRGVDLYGYVSPRGRSLRAVLVHHADYVKRPEAWPGRQITPYRGENAGLFEVAYAALGVDAYREAVEAVGRPLEESRVMGPVSLTHGQKTQ